MSKTLCRLVLFVIALSVAAAPVAAVGLVPPVAPSAIVSPGDAGGLDVVALAFGLSAAVAMALKVKDTGSIAKKFIRNAQAAAPDYTEGVKQAGQDWEAGARAGAENYKAGVLEAASQGRFERGVAAAGASKYTTNASTKGAQRFGPGVAAAEGDFAKGVQPFLDTIKGLTLPPRRPKGDPANQERANVVARALRARKVGQ